MASNPLFIIPDFFLCLFSMNFAMATLGLKKMGQFSLGRLGKNFAQLANREDLFPYPPKGILPFPSNLR